MFRLTILSYLPLINTKRNTSGLAFVKKFKRAYYKPLSFSPLCLEKDPLKCNEKWGCYKYLLYLLYLRDFEALCV